MTTYQLGKEKSFWNNFDVLPLVADRSVFIPVHIGIATLILASISTYQSRPWSLNSFFQWILVLLFTIAFASTTFIHFNLFQPFSVEGYVKREVYGLSGQPGELIKQYLVQVASSDEVFLYLMSLFGVIVTHLIMRPWIGSGREFGA